MATADRITTTEWARRTGRNPRTVSAAIRSGRISRGDDGKIDPDEAERDWEANTNSTMSEVGKRNGGPAYGTYSENRRVREEYQAKLAELEFKRKAGELVSAAEVERVYFARARRARNMLLAIPAQLGAVLAGISDPNECERRLKTRIRAICEELAGES